MSSAEIAVTTSSPHVRRSPLRRALTPGNIIFWIFAILVVFLVLVPLYILIKTSVSSLAQATAPRPSYLIENPTFENWDRLAQWSVVGEPLMHSVTVATGTAIIAILLAAPFAYVAARLPGNYRYPVILAVLFTRMFPEVIIATPIAERFFGWGLNDTDVGLILAHLIRTLPLAAWILIGSFEAIPIDLEESSSVDGAGKLTTLRRVVMPLALPGIAVAAMFAWLDSWNDLLYAIYLFIQEDTLPLLTYYYSNRGNVTDVATFSVLMTIPVFFITLFLQRYIQSGTLTGAVKG
jgi:trehalose transport system permease protein